MTATAERTRRAARPASSTGPTGASRRARGARAAAGSPLGPAASKRAASKQADAVVDALGAIAADLDEQDAEQEARDPIGLRLRTQATPHYAIGLLAFAGCATRAAAVLTGEEAIVAASVAAAAFVAAVVAGVVARRKLNDKRARRWVNICAIGAASWLTWATGLGISWDAVGLLAALGYAAALPWWRDHRIPNTPLVDEQPAENIGANLDDPNWDGYIALWAEKLAGPGRELPHSRLYGREPIDAGWRYVLELDGGKQTLDDVRAKAPKIRTGLKLRRGQDLIIEEHPDLDEDCLLVTIITRPIVAPGESIPWPGIGTYADGRIAMGPYVDGEGTGFWRLYTEHSMWGGYLSGTTGVGKSRIMDAIALAAAGTGNTVVWFADGQDGASSPGLARWYDWFADRTNAGELFAAAVAIMDFRAAENLVDEIEGFTPTRERPGLLILVDECQELFSNPVLQKAATRIARKGRKCGIAIIAASQAPNIDVFGPMPDANVLRTCLTAGNLAMLHTTQKSASNLIPGIPVNPTTLPAIPGYVFVAARGEGARDAAVRGYYVADPKAEAARIPMPALDLGSQTAGGKKYRHRSDASDKQRAEAAARVAKMRAGVHTAAPATDEDTAPATPAANGARVIQFPTFAPPTTSTMPTGTAATAAAGAAPAAAAGGGELSGSQRKLLAALAAAGPSRPAELAEALGVTPRQVNNLLRELATAGLVTQDGLPYGHHAATDQGHQALAS